MRVQSLGIVDGVILDKYGKRGDRDSKTRMPTLSFPLDILDAPVDTMSYAIVFDDPDSVPVCGFTWIHWLAITTNSSLKENASMDDATLVQGKNSWGVNLYGGMAPPDRPHTYVVTVYALDCKLELDNGFTLDELYSSMKDHILDKCVLKGLYDN